MRGATKAGSFADLEDNESVTSVKQELLDIVFWVKLIVCVVVGVAVGVAGVRGAFGFLALAAAVVASGVGYPRLFLRADEELVETGELFNENLAGCIGGFLTSWILAYSAAGW